MSQPRQIFAPSAACRLRKVSPRHSAPMVLMVALSVGACSTLPQRPPAPVSHALTPQIATTPSDNSVFPLVDPLEAFAVRVQLIRQAQQSLDLAYYIWGNDLTGWLMLEELRQAAARGVRVRLLLDDNNTRELDALLVALSRTPNLEIRLYNPFRYRDLRVLNYVIDPRRMQRRMHGKSMTADGAVSIVGGRNIADPYFRVAADFFFADLDVLFDGAATQQVQRNFDAFWNDSLAYPVQGFLRPSVRRQQIAIQNLLNVHHQAQALPYIRSAEQSQLLQQWLDQDNTQDEANADATAVQQSAYLVYDDPAKVHRYLPFEQTIGARVLSLSGVARFSLDIVSPYFVPQQAGTQQLVRLAQQGVRIRILTNSLAASDVPIIHDFYARRRRELVQAGIELYEFKPFADSQPISRWRIRERLGHSSHGSLHAKAISWDRQMTYVGSMNLDPRSLLINSELGVMIPGEEAAAQVSAVFDGQILKTAYRVEPDPQQPDRLIWREIDTEGRPQIHHREPAASTSRKLWSRLAGWLPIEFMM